MEPLLLTIRLAKSGALGSTVDPPVEPPKQIYIEQIIQPAPLRRPHSPSKRNQPPRDNAHDTTDNKSRTAPPAVIRGNRGRFTQRSNPRRSNVEENVRNGPTEDDDWGREKSSAEIKSPAKEKKSSPEVKTGVSVKQDAADAPEVEPVPDAYLVEKIPMGASFVLSVDATASESQAGPGYVCVSMHSDFGDVYAQLVDDFAADCASADDSYSPKIGETFSYLDPSDQGWYRARRVSPVSAVLLDAARTVTLSPRDKVCALPPQYRGIPEFCCVIDQAQIGSQLKCVLLSGTPSGFKVSVSTAEDDTPLGDALITRWQPALQWPTEQLTAAHQQRTPKQQQTQSTPKKQQVQPTPKQIEPTPKQQQTQPTPKQQQIQPTPQQPTNQPIAKITPEVPRPVIKNNCRYVLLDVTSLKRACVHACEDTVQFDSVLQDVALHGITSAAKLTEPPKPGQLVLSKYQEAHYRALVLKTKAKDNRYMIEYVEYGNNEIVPLENLYACSPELDLSQRPTTASIIQLSTKDTSELTEPAVEYINSLKEVEELIVTIPGGTKTVPSGALVHLSIAKNNESVNKKLEDMCMPDWKKLEEKGGDVIESECLMFREMRHIGLPTDRPFVLNVTDYTQLNLGSITGFERGAPLREIVYGRLTDKINAYANSELCSEPYLPKLEELCIAKFPPFPQWFRAVMMEQIDGAGGKEAQVLYVDYGNIATVSVAHLRKMMPEFIKEPALANHCEIKDWPPSPTVTQLKRAEDFLQLDDEGHGQLPVKRAYQDEDSIYIIEAPDLIAAISSV